MQPLKNNACKPIRTPMSKQQLLKQLSHNTGLSQTKVQNLLDELSQLIAGHLHPTGAGQFTLPGLFKIITQDKPATPERTGINPFTGKQTVFAAKPASRTVKLRPLKKLKEMASQD